MKRADLHIHTYYSDGGQSPADVVRAAKACGVNVLSVTDHDNSNARKETAALCKEAGIDFVDGEEVSAYDNEVKVHLLCYGMDYSSPVYQAFNARLMQGAEERTFDILKKLASVGIKISYGDVARERKCRRSPMHGMYIAVAGARKGYASSPFDFYVKYLNFGRVGFSNMSRPTPEETVKTCYECGGFCSLAHPGRISMDKEGVIKLIERLLPFGLGGIEAVYSGHTDSQTQYYKELAEKYSLLITGGSDTHYAEGNRKVGVPYFVPSEELLSALKIE